MPLIKKGIKEILQGKDKNWAGPDGNGVLGALKQTGEAFLGGAANAAIGVATDFIAEISPFAKKDNNYADIGDADKKGGGVHEYGMYKDMAKARGYGFTDGNPPVAGLAGFGIAAGIGGYAAANEQRVWDVEILEPQVRINSVLEERSYIDFYFPNTRMGSGDGIRRIAFFENAKIREDRSSRYSSQNIVARNEPVRLFTGADARKLKLDFTYTIPHIEYFFRLCNTAALAGFMSNPKTGAGSTGSVGLQGQPLRGGNHWDHRRFVKAYLDKFFGTSFEVDTGSRLSFTNKDRITGPRAYEPQLQEPKDGYNNNKTNDNEQRLLRALSKNDEDLGSDGMMATYYTQFAIDTIRASVVGDQLTKGPVGPPIVRFRHGTVFNESPFIVKNFSIDYPTDKGFEYRTLMPRQVKFSLTLEEFHQTKGSHHGDVNELVPDASQIVDLVIKTSNPTLPVTNRRRGLGG